MTSKAFELACSNAISGWLWDETFSPSYSESVSLSVDEMRYIANLMRRKERIAREHPQPWNEEKATKDIA